MKKLILSLLVIGCFFISQLAYSAEDFAIGYISLGRIFEGYKKVLESNGKLDQEKNKVKVMIDDMQKLKEGFDTLNDTAKEERKNQMLAKQEEVRKRTADLRKEEDLVLREILKDVETAAGEIRNKKKLTYIIDDRLIIDGPKDMDLTNEIISMLNERYKGK